MTSLFVHLITKLDYNVWRQHSGLPEMYDASYKVATSNHYGLRPGKYFSPIGNLDYSLIALAEFIESTWYLYRVRLFLHSTLFSSKILS